MNTKSMADLVFEATDSLEAPSKSDDALDILREAASGLMRRLGSNVQVRIEPGFSVNIGQQYNMVIRVPTKDQPGYTGNLFRAYIPSDGYPVTLDLFGDRGTVCNSGAELTSAILTFLKHADVVQRLRALKDLAA